VQPLITKRRGRNDKNEISTTDNTQRGDVKCNVTTGRQPVEYKRIILTAGVKFVRRRHTNTSTHIASFLSLFPSSHYKVNRTDYLRWLMYKRSPTNRKFCIFVTRKDNDYRKSIQYFSIYYTKFSGNREIALRQLLRFHCL
jgi:hypothetical protein